MASYTYRALREGQIRTLSIGLSHSGNIRGFLGEVQLESAEFIAVSYVWGAETNLSTIWLEEYPLQITANAYEVLRTFIKLQDQQHSGDSFTSTGLWIDAICIDQRNDAEKRGQIAMIQDIYAGAQQTIIQLGAPSSPAVAARVVDCLESLLRYGSPREWPR